MDLALARKLKEIISDVLNEARPPINALHWLQDYLGVRNLLQMQRDVVLPETDVTLDGTTSLEELVSTAIHEITSRSDPHDSLP